MCVARHHDCPLLQEYLLTWYLICMFLVAVHTDTLVKFTILIDLVEVILKPCSAIQITRSLLMSLSFLSNHMLLQTNIQQAKAQ